MWNLHIYHWASNFKQMQPYARNRWFFTWCAHARWHLYLPARSQQRRLKLNFMKAHLKYGQCSCSEMGGNTTIKTSPRQSKPHIATKRNWLVSPSTTNGWDDEPQKTLGPQYLADKPQWLWVDRSYQSLPRPLQKPLALRAQCEKSCCVPIANCK